MNKNKIDFKIALMSHIAMAPTEDLLNTLWKDFVRSKRWITTHKQTSQELKEFRVYEYNRESYKRFFKDYDVSRKEQVKHSIAKTLKI